ncbi:MAG: hypothetical protein M3R63_01390 [Actinomycetota bacterium]|nr:hypothetical protein [Actinomycetota bacterium]
MNTWWCPCGKNGTGDGVPATARGLTQHLEATGHPCGEYSYGNEEHRTTVQVELDPDRSAVHRLTNE